MGQGPTLRAVDLGKNTIDPGVVVRRDDQHAKAMALAFDSNAFCVVDMQIDSERRRKFRRPRNKRSCGHCLPMSLKSDDAVDPQAMPPNKKFDAIARPERRGINPNGMIALAKCGEHLSRSRAQSFDAECARYPGET